PAMTELHHVVDSQLKLVLKFVVLPHIVQDFLSDDRCGSGLWGARLHHKLRVRRRDRSGHNVDVRERLVHHNAVLAGGANPLLARIHVLQALPSVVKITAVPPTAGGTHVPPIAFQGVLVVLRGATPTLISHQASPPSSASTAARRAFTQFFTTDSTAATTGATATGTPRDATVTTDSAA